MLLRGRLGRNFKREEDMGEKLQFNSCSGSGAPTAGGKNFTLFYKK